ncbi:AraC family transcriptional regulator [Nocardia farcinica]|nr:AraC family transcriptional regulator [Nocardia farcinica]MBF6269208.1 AraC family transcriptional regulator [Nocardia farcinica]
MVMRVCDDGHRIVMRWTIPVEEPLQYEDRPLARHQLTTSGDPDLVRSAVGTAFCDHRLSPLRRDIALDAHFHGVRWDTAGVYYLEYGTDVRIDPRDLDDFYLIQVPLEGHAAITVGSRSFVSTPEVASVLEPGDRVSMAWEGANRQLLLRLDRATVHDAVRKKLGREPAAPLVFDPRMDLTTPANRTWRGLLTLLVDAIDRTAAPTSIAVQEFEGLLVSQLILGQPHNYRDELDRKPQPVVSRPIAKAAELIEAHAHEPLTVDDIADAVGIGTRTLQDGFRRYYNTTPMAFLRDVRLRRVRTDLLQADPTLTTVTDIAIRWGFLHPGRFSVLYRDRFGESPSQTLRLATDGAAQTAAAC